MPMFTLEIGRIGFSLKRGHSWRTWAGFCPGTGTSTTSPSCRRELRNTSECDPVWVNILDLTIELGENSDVKTKWYRKPTPTNNLLHADSFHPRSLVYNIPVGQCLHACRNCTETADFETEAKYLRKKFIQRSYQRRWLTNAYQRAKDDDKEAFIFKETGTDKDRIPKTKIRLQFSELVPRIRDICIHTHWHLLTDDDTVRKLVPNRLQFIYRRAHVLGHLLIHIDRKCGASEFCRFMLEGNSLTLWNGKVLKCKGHANCNTSSVISCGAYYIGKMIRTVRRRLKDHIYNIATYHLKAPVARHLCLNHKRDSTSLKCWVLEVVNLNPRRGNFHQIFLQRETQ